MDSADPVTGLDEVVHQRIRLSILAILGEARRADFGYLKTRLHVTDGNLGQHIAILARHGLVTVTKGHQGKRPRTWVAMTRAGDAALANEVSALTALLGL